MIPFSVENTAFFHCGTWPFISSFNGGRAHGGYSVTVVLNELGMRVVNDEIETSLACPSGGICHSSELVSHL